MKASKLSLALLTMSFVMVVSNSFALPAPLPTPDAGSTALLMSMGVAGIVVVKRFIR